MVEKKKKYVKEEEERKNERNKEEEDEKGLEDRKEIKLEDYELKGEIAETEER